MRTVMILLISIVLLVFAAVNTDLFRDPATIAAQNRYRNARAAEIEVDVDHKAQLYALDIRRQEVALQEQEAAIRRSELWTTAMIDMAWVVVYIVTGVGALVAVLWATAYAYRAFIARSVEAYWSARGNLTKDGNSAPPSSAAISSLLVSKTGNNGHGRVGANIGIHEVDERRRPQRYPATSVN